jgi:hypothetical protein
MKKSASRRMPRQTNINTDDDEGLELSETVGKIKACLLLCKSTFIIHQRDRGKAPRAESESEARPRYHSRAERHGRGRRE